jgi:hypothetical protein
VVVVPELTLLFGSSSAREVMTVRRQTVSQEAIKRSVARSTKASARLESRVVPQGYVRSATIAKFIASRKPRD